MRAHWGALGFLAGLIAAEDGLNGWLRYAPLPEGLRPNITQLPSLIVVLNTTATSNTPISVAASELQAGIKGILGTELEIATEATNKSIVVGTVDAYSAKYRELNASALEEDGYWLIKKGPKVQILGKNERGALYGAFEYLSRLAKGDFSDVDIISNPDVPIRWTNEWDNLDGSIERGYAGPSIFFRNGGIVKDLTRVRQYARLLASLGINAIVVNNVNANANLLNNENIDGLGRIADTIRPYGLQLGISLNFASPQLLGGLSSFDPLDSKVIEWWTEKTNQLYKRVPDLAGYLVKANSEGQPGPLTYNRTLADGANLFARAVKPHGGIVMFRAFVYNHHADWNDWKFDRANAAVEFFKHLDGKFLDNVVVQIKYGPIDFQVREPASPLFANIPNTNMAIELQITQEYLGHQDHLVYIAPLWKEILDFDMRVDSKPSLVRDIVAGRRYNKKLGGYAGVSNVGTNTTWLGSHLAMSNLYAYGKLAWDPTQDSVSILQDWTKLTFGHDRSVLDTITKISMESWPAYENYTGNLGIQTLTDILYTHFGPNPASQDGNGWGQWTRADGETIGMDRTVKNGTGNAGQYPPELAEKYENIETTPENLLLWYHHVNYTTRLSTGKTVIQHFYDAHYDGAATAQTFVTAWETLRGKIDTERFEHVLFRLKFQAGHSIVWRDAINGFYRNLSGIPDELGRVWNHKYRIEAERMQLKGYVPVKVFPTETASNFTAIVVSNSTTGARGEAVAVLDVDAGTYDIAINYYDVTDGRAHYGAFLNDEPLLEWIGDLEDKLGHAFSTKLDGHSATRIGIEGVELKKGDVLKIIGIVDGIELAPLDYVSILPAGIID